MNKKPKPMKIYYKIKIERTWLQTLLFQIFNIILINTNKKY
jgi:hypothetical protein